MTSGTSAGTRVLGLDIVRAAAILLVLITHYSINYWGVLTSEPTPPAAIMIAGLFGVHLFFALSGYLIGNILLGVIERGLTIDTLWRFWMRRWLRTLPCYYLAILIAIWANHVCGYSDYKLWPYLTLSQNLFSTLPGSFLGVSWSLMIEEWFYFAFPLLLFPTIALSRRHGMLIALSAIIILSAVIRPIAWERYGFGWPEGLRIMVPFQLDAIAYGALASLIVRGRNISSAARRISAAAGIALLIVCWYALARGAGNSLFFMANGLFIGSAVGGSLIVVGFAGLMTAPKAVAAPAQFLSTHAYTLYLVHMELMGVVAYYVYFHFWPVWTMVILGPLAGFFVAMCITRFFEIPIMLRRPKQFKPEGGGSLIAFPALSPIP